MLHFLADLNLNRMSHSCGKITTSQNEVVMVVIGGEASFATDRRMSMETFVIGQDNKVSD